MNPNQIDLSGFASAVQAQQLAVRGMRVYQGGELIAVYQPEPERRQNQYSCTKSFTSTACGFAIQEGLFSLEDRVLDHFASDAPEHPSEYLQRLTLRHLITMSMGGEAPLLMGPARPKMVEKDWVRFVLGSRLVHEPGTVFQYSNAGPYLLGILIQRRSGQSLIEYLTPRLFGPLEIPTPEAELDPLGNTFGAGGLMLNVSELAKLGLLYLQQGRWQGRQLLPAEWVAQASAPQIEADEGDEEIGHHYGYQFWTMPEGAYRADGKYGQYCVVLPKQNAVIAINSMQLVGEKAVLRAALRTVVPLL